LAAGGGSVVDLLVRILVGSVPGFCFTIVQVIAASGHPDRRLVLKLRQTTFASFLLATLGSLVYHTGCEGLHGSTLSKLVLSMVVVQEHGSPCRLKGAVVRSMGYLLDALFFGLVGYSEMQKTSLEQRHGDEWTHIVVGKHSSAPGSLRGRRPVCHGIVFRNHG
jgi:hypothetical protein